MQQQQMHSNAGYSNLPAPSMYQQQHQQQYQQPQYQQPQALYNAGQPYQYAPQGQQAMYGAPPPPPPPQGNAQYSHMPSQTSQAPPPQAPDTDTVYYDYA
mmetsp:Transcript_24690/g.53263  ORF Transcript_24690/g.53263 Transcript_24690/m.53263 type:complete len:100 (+) Transcript_24690:3-302(+)